MDTSVREHHSKLQHGGKSIFSEGINDIHKQQMALLSLGLFLRLLIETRFSFIPQKLDTVLTLFSLQAIIKMTRI